jgi:hypothetical protein
LESAEPSGEVLAPVDVAGGVGGVGGGFTVASAVWRLAAVRVLSIAWCAARSGMSAACREAELQPSIASVGSFAMCSPL